MSDDIDDIDDIAPLIRDFLSAVLAPEDLAQLQSLLAAVRAEGEATEQDGEDPLGEGAGPVREFLEERLTPEQRRDPIRPRPASPIGAPGSPAGSPATIARRGAASKGRSPCSNPTAMTIWPFVSDRTPASALWSGWRSRHGPWATSNARFHSSTACRRG